VVAVVVELDPAAEVPAVAALEVVVAAREPGSGR